MEQGETNLVDKNQYLTAGAYIGMKSCTPYMKHFVYKVREDGLCMFNLKKIEERTKIAADFLSRFDDILVVGRKETAKEAVRAFAKVVNAQAVIGRFNPGMLTNPTLRDFIEPDILLVADPLVDEQAVKEAKIKRIPIVAIANTFNEVKDIDLIIPANNNGKKSMALLFWILAKELLKRKGKIKKDAEFTPTLKDFGDVEVEEAVDEDIPIRKMKKETKPKKKMKSTL